MWREEEEPHLGCKSASCEKHYEPGAQQDSSAGRRGLAERLDGHFCFIQVPSRPLPAQPVPDRLTSVLITQMDYKCPAWIPLLTLALTHLSLLENPFLLS